MSWAERNSRKFCSFTGIKLSLPDDGRLSNPKHYNFIFQNTAQPQSSVKLSSSKQPSLPSSSKQLLDCLYGKQRTADPLPSTVNLKPAQRKPVQIPKLVPSIASPAVVGKNNGAVAKVETAPVAKIASPIQGWFSSGQAQWATA